MKSNQILTIIDHAKQRDEHSIVELVARFKPLLRKYARLLAYDDAYADLECEFLTIVMSFPPILNFANDGAAVNYIHKSIYHFYIHISKKADAEKAVTFYNDLTDKQRWEIAIENGSMDDYSEIEVDIFRDALTYKEFDVVYRHYVLDFTIEEIACQDGITRQSVNRTKNRGLRKMKIAHSSQLLQNYSG